MRSVYIQLRHTPVVILYTQEQIDDLRLLCSKECIPSLHSVLSVDRTFNLSSLFATVMVYKNKKVITKRTQEPPFFIRPIMLHGDGKYATYHHFFSAVNAALAGAVVESNKFICDGLMTGSDEELALVSAAKNAFPQAKQLYCMIHCKDNVRHYLSTIGVATAVRENVLARLFGCNGVSEAADADTMDDPTESPTSCSTCATTTLMQYRTCKTV